MHQHYPHTHAPSDCLIQWLVIIVEKKERERERERGRENSGTVKQVVFSFHFHSRDYIWLNSENPESGIITVWFLMPFPSFSPNTLQADVLMLIAYLLLFMSRGRTFYSRAMECWIKWWFSCTNIERAFQEKQFPLHCLSKSPQSSCCSHKGPVKR